ncbi:MAG: nucleotide exchange factor GrpE [Candidatus Micrarchaeia archaeon]
MAEDNGNRKESKEEKNLTGKKAEEAKEKETAEKESLEGESSNEKLLRLAAEFDNYKKRVGKEIAVAKEMGKAELIKKLLPTLDEFEIAISAMNEGEAKKGIELIYSNFIEVLKGEGLKEIEAKGTFDPYKHEIVMVKELKDENTKDGAILEVVRKGYAINDIVLRPASIIIAKKA